MGKERFRHWLEDFFLGSEQLYLWPWVDQLLEPSIQLIDSARHGLLSRYAQVVEAIDLCPRTLDSPNPEGNKPGTEALHGLLWALRPWRKGPFSFGPVTIDSEWRSDLKLERLMAGLGSVEGMRVMDIGCGNGYFMGQLRDRGARSALGVEPMALYNAQFWADERWHRRSDIAMVPLRDSQIPAAMGCFDLVLSMGVVYHHRNPWDHVAQCAGQLAPGGTLIIESIVMEGEPLDLGGDHRYGKMRNVWTIPTVPIMKNYMERAGLVNIRIVDVSPTTGQEQRPSPWMQYESLPDFLGPDGRTIEGYPGPIRAMVMGVRP